MSALYSPDGNFEGGCHAARDGDCEWDRCPQLRDGEPAASGRHCPIDVRDDDE